MNQYLFVFVAIYLAIAAGLVSWICDPATAFTLPLFGSSRVLSVYAVAVLPLTTILATRLSHVLTIRSHLLVAIVCLVSVLLWPTASIVLGQHQANYLMRGMVRCMTALVISFPISVALVRHLQQSRPLLVTKAGLTMALAGAAFLPAIYVHRQVSTLRTSYLQAATSKKVAHNLRVVACYWELHGDAQFDNYQLQSKLKELKRQFRELTAQVDLPDNGTRDERHTRAMWLLSLDRISDAEQVLTQLKPDSTTLLLLAIAARERSDWHVLEERSRTLMLLNTNDKLARELLAEACHMQQNYAEALLQYRSLATEESQDAVEAASLRVRLARVLMDMGDREAALRNLSIAQELDPSLSSQASLHVRAIVQSTCSLR